MKKKLWMVVAVTLLAGLLAGCAGGNGQNADKQPASTKRPGATDKAEETSAPKSNTFSMLINSHPSYPYNKDWMVWKTLEEKTGAKFEIQTPSGELADTINLAVASGEMPDLMFMYGKASANKFGQQGALVNILDYTEEMPNFKKWMEQYPDITKSQIAADGNMYMFPNEGFGEGNRMVWMYREDVFKQHNLTAPTTFDELHAVLKQLKELYPESYPLSFRLGNNLLILKLLSAQFDTNQSYYLDQNEVEFGPTADSYKTMLEYLNKFYAEGLIPPDWLTVDAKKWQDLISTDKSFITIDYIGRIDFFNSALRADRPEFNMSFMAPPIGIDGGKPLNAYMHVVDSGLTVASTSKQINEIMSTIDYFYSEEGRDSHSWGKEGETYTVDNGTKKLSGSFKDIIDFQNQTGLLTSGTYTWVDYNSLLSLASVELQHAFVEARKYDAPYYSIPDFNQGELEIITTTGAAIDKYRDENVIQFIIGKQSFDNWNNYVNGLNNLGLSKIIELYKGAYSRAAGTSLK